MEPVASSHAVRISQVPVTAGLVVAGGTVMASAADTGWEAAKATIIVALLMLSTRLAPAVMLAAGGVLGGLALL
jgi:chromate transporter